MIPNKPGPREFFKTDPFQELLKIITHKVAFRGGRFEHLPPAALGIVTPLIGVILNSRKKHYHKMGCGQMTAWKNGYGQMTEWINGYI